MGGQTVPTVLWLANLEVPDLQLRGGRRKTPSRCVFEPWEKLHVVIIFILK